MGRLKIPEITTDSDVLSQTIMDMLGVDRLRAWDAASLFEAQQMMPFTTYLVFDKIFGRWVFTNEDEDDWCRLMSGHHCSGPNFSFVESTPEMAMINGIHYYYHTRIKE